MCSASLKKPNNAVCGDEKPNNAAFADKSRIARRYLPKIPSVDSTKVAFCSILKKYAMLFRYYFHRGIQRGITLSKSK